MSEGRTYDLEPVRVDGWLEQLAEGSPGFAQLREVVGERFVAFSFIAGVQITGLTFNPRDPESSVVDFAVGDPPQIQQLLLGELRQRLAEAVVADDPPAATLPDQPSPEDLQAYLGFRYVLLAPLFGLRLEELRIRGRDPRVRLRLEGEAQEVTLEELQDAIRGLVAAEAEQYRPPSAFSIDLTLVDEARAAADEGRPEEVARILGAWPGPLSVLLRTPDGQALGLESRALLAEGLGLLGSAYVELDQVDWGLEILRLGVQWGQEQAEASAELFLRLGRAHLASQRAGEAIGLLRRALTLGASPAVVLPELARCFVARDRILPALLVAEEAVASGADPAPLAALGAAAREQLGEAWARFADLRDGDGSELGG
ncbi:MAG: hypothetical protein ACFCGT_06120 [Sandaracinaceae bacterium]